MVKPNTTQVYNLHNHNFISHVKDPYCKQQTKLQLAVTILFHTIIFPFGLYRLGQIFYHYCCKRSAIPAGKQLDSSKLNSQAIHSIHSTPQQKALDAAELAEKLAVANNPALLTNHQFKTAGAHNDKICRLMNLFDKTLSKFNESIDVLFEEPTFDKKTIELADTLMSLSYAISHYALEDLESFTQSLSESDREIWAKKTCFLARLYKCGQCYHKTLAASKGKVGITMQQNWRTLYNDICTKIQHHLSSNPVLTEITREQATWTQRELSQTELAFSQPNQIPLQRQAAQSAKTRVYSSLEQVVRAHPPSPANVIAPTNTPALVVDEPAPIRQAKEFAEAILATHANKQFTPSKFKTGGPNNQKIELLRYLNTTKYIKALIQAIKKNPANPWNTPEVQKAANETMKINYAISHYTLEDANSFTNKLAKSQRNKKTLRENFFKNGALVCGKVYHFCKNRSVWSTELDRTISSYIDSQQKDLFHDPKQIENSWNILYNDICTRMQCLLNTSSPIFVDFPSDMAKYMAHDR